MDFAEINRDYLQRCRGLSTVPTRHSLLVSIPAQQMRVQVDGEAVHHFAVSTSKRPPSCQADSFGTPTGLHAIADRIGADQPVGMVFKGRVPTGRCYPEYSGEAAAGNLITSRILRLRGLEVGLNSGPGVDSFERYIYIHGTNHEDRIGRPFSGGCVELSNRDVIELFDLVAPGDHVYIFATGET